MSETRTSDGQAIPYRNPGLPVAERVADLLARMTLEEKVGQLSQTMGRFVWRNSADGFEVTETGRAVLGSPGIGALYGVLRSDPWMGATLEGDGRPRWAAELTNALQRFAIENTRLGIPLLFGEECAHGHMARGATVFPVSLALATAWDPALVYEVGRASATEARAQGGNVTYAPVLDVARDPRWGRTEETYGEDPYLCARLAEAAVRGLQGDSFAAPDTLIATAKHFLHGAPEGGRNIAPAHMGERELRSLFLSPFAAAIRAGVGSVMPSYNEIDGVPCTANRWLIGRLLREELGFDGFVTSDWEAIRWLAEVHGVASDLGEAAALALAAGIDIEMQGLADGGAYAAPLKQAVQDGRVPITWVDQAVTRILRAKFQLGLFERPYVDPERAGEVVRCHEHRELARAAARRGMVLLKNEDGLLPLRKDLRTIAVIGPNADDHYNQLGDYTGLQRRTDIITLLDGVRAAVSPQTDVLYVRGCGVREPEEAGIAKAVAAARAAEVAILVVGGSSAQDFDTTGTNAGIEIVSGPNPDRDCGEHFDRASLELSGMQLELARSVIATGIPTVVVLIQGRPASIPWLAEHAPAILCAWYPGEQGGHAAADLLFGDHAPSGRLPISIPKSAGQLPVSYNLKPSSPSLRGQYVEMDVNPLYPFGNGLTYTTFAYTELRVTPEQIPPDGQATVSVEVTNTGPRAGEAVVQFYLRDVICSVTRPVKELFGFARVKLAPGEVRTATCRLGPEHLGFVDQDMRRRVEPGVFTITAGADARAVLEAQCQVIRG
jgi:beta-glucosidase